MTDTGDSAEATPRLRIEHACQGLGRDEDGELLDDVAALEADPVSQVRRAARRAAVRVVEAGE